MEKLYFMDVEFEADWFVRLDDAIEGGKVKMLFDDSWYWYRYSFFGRDSVCSEESDALRTHLLNLVALLYRHYDEVLENLNLKPDALQSVIDDLLRIVELSRQCSVCLWIYGDESCKEWLAERRALLPEEAQMRAFIELPHHQRSRKERLHYRHIDDKAALARFRNELAAFNKRRKIDAKNQQRQASDS
jgi:hypothetical protein